MGDFNDYSDSPSLRILYAHGFVNVTAKAEGRHGAKGTYRYRGGWGSIDHILVSENLRSNVSHCLIHDAPFLLEEDTKYGGVKPRRIIMVCVITMGLATIYPWYSEWVMKDRSISFLSEISLQ